MSTPEATCPHPQSSTQHLQRELGLLDATLLVAGSMIGSGIFIVSADIARQVNSPGWLMLVWLFSGVLTLIAALSYGELAAMLPKAGGQYVYLRAAYGPLCAFSYGWTLFMVIQTGTIAAVAIAFARFLGVLWPSIAPNHLIADWGLLTLPGIGNLSLSLSTQQVVAILITLLLTYTNLTGLRNGKIIQSIFTLSKIGALLILIIAGLVLNDNPEAAIHASDFWIPMVNGQPFSILQFALVLATAMVGAIFSADAWNNVTFTSGEVKHPERNIPLSMGLGVGLVVVIYLLANLVYLQTLSFEEIQHATEDRVGVASAQYLFGDSAVKFMAIAIMISTFGCINGMILSGARVYYSMAQDGLFFPQVGRLNASHVPANALILQCLWSIVLILPRTFDSQTHSYSNLYGNLLDYIVFAVMIFYIITISGIFILRKTHPNVPRPVRAWGYPYLPALYIICASCVCLALLIADKTRINALMGLLVVLSSIPVYALWHGFNAAGQESPTVDQ